MNEKLGLYVVSSKYESSCYLLFLLNDCQFRANAWYIQMLMSIQIFVFKFIKELLYTQSYLFCSFQIDCMEINTYGIRVFLIFIVCLKFIKN